MKPSTSHIILLIFILLQSGCSENDKPGLQESRDLQYPDNSAENQPFDSIYHLKDQAVTSRFQFYPEDNQYKTIKKEVEPDSNFEYYRPSAGIEKSFGLPANGILINSGRLKEKDLSFRISPFPLEQVLFKKGKTSQDIFFIAIFDNDIFDYTDYYFTNGIGLELYHPAISASPLTRALPGLRNSINFYSLSLVQNLYTPRKLEELSIRIGDRPFAAYLTIGHQRISLSPDRLRRLQSELALGVIGPSSQGCVAQDLIHTNEPAGWVNQVKNDIVLNYNIRFDQGIYSGNGIELAVFTGGQAGTLFDNIMAGFYLQAGKSNNRYGSVFQTTGHQRPFKKRVRYYFSLDVKNKLIIYDATLQGGMFNRESAYKLDGSQVNRYIFTGTASFGLGLGRYSLEAEQVFLTPEFDGGRHHFWFRIKNIIYLN